MSAKPSKVGPVLTVVVTVVMVLTASSWLPTSLGGQASYLVTSGNSMEPGIHQGDLVILREASQYEVGDAVAYHDPTIGRVFHRIVGRDGDAFVMQGDNNTWTDDHQPTQEEIVGAMWIHIPGMGTWVDRARQPLPMAVLAALAGFLVLAPQQAAKRLRKRAHRPPAQNRAEQPVNGGGGSAGILGPDGQTAMMIVGVLTLASIMLALLAYSRPVERETTSATEFQHSGAFDYSASARGDVYEGGAVEAGQPVYRALVDAVDLSFSYVLDADLPSNTAGTYRLDAVVAYDEGLTRTIPLVPETPFEGSEFETVASLRLSDVQQIIDQIARQIGVTNGAGGEHLVSIVPTVNLTGVVAGQELDETFAPSFDFTLDDLALRPESPTIAPDGNTASDPFNQVKTGTIEQPATEAATLSIFVLDVDVSTARQIAIAGLLLSGLALAILGGLYWNARRAAEPRQIQARYRPLLVTVNGSDLGINGRVVEVASIEDLARVAEREGRMILHQQRDTIHDYFVQDVDVTYRYSSTGETPFPGNQAMEPTA